MNYSVLLPSGARLTVLPPGNSEGAETNPECYRVVRFTHSHRTTVRMRKEREVSEEDFKKHQAKGYREKKKKKLAAVVPEWMQLLGVLFLFCCWPSISSAQKLPDAPSHTKQVVFANLAMYGSSVVGAHATSHGSHACFLEEPTAFGKSPTGENIGLPHPYRTYFKRSLPIDAGISLLSFWAVKKHHHLLAVLAPTSATGFQLGVAGMQYSAGCF